MPEQYLYLLVINTPGRKQEMHILPSTKNGTSTASTRSTTYQNTLLTNT